MRGSTAADTAALVAVVAVASVVAGGIAFAGPASPAAVAGAPADVAQEETVPVRVVHASPDAPPVDVYFDGELVLSEVPFGGVSEYLDAGVGDHTFTVTAAGNRSAEVFNGTVTFEAGQRYTVAATGEVTGGAPTSFAPLVLEDATSAPEAGNASVRVVHLSPDAPAVDVVVNETGEVLVENVTFRNASDYVAVPAGDYTLDVRPTGEETVLATVDVTLSEGTAYSAFAIGYVDTEAAAGDQPFAVGLVEDFPGEEEMTETPGVATETPTEEEGGT